MTKSLRRAVTCLVLASYGLLLGRPADARLTGTNPTGSSADQFCVGKTSSEACVDSSGNVLPTTANTQSLGTSALPFGTVYSQTQVNTGNETVSGASTAGTAGTMNNAGTTSVASLNVTDVGAHVFGKVSLTGIVASTIIPVMSSYMVLLGTGPTTAVDITATPSIATTTVLFGATAIPSGTFLLITSTSSAGVVLTDEGTLTGSKLQLGAATRTITALKTLLLVFDAVDGYWREVAFGNN